MGHLQYILPKMQLLLCKNNAKFYIKTCVCVVLTSIMNKNKLSEKNLSRKKKKLFYKNDIHYSGIFKAKEVQSNSIYFLSCLLAKKMNIYISYSYT